MIIFFLILILVYILYIKTNKITSKNQIIDYLKKDAIQNIKQNLELNNKIKIPIPSIEKQKEIIEYCEFNDELIKNLEKEIENNKKLAEEFIKSIIKSDN